MGPYVLPGNNYHVYDYPLFWANVRVVADALWRHSRRNGVLAQSRRNDLRGMTVRGFPISVRPPCPTAAC